MIFPSDFGDDASMRTRRIESKAFLLEGVFEAHVRFVNPLVGSLTNPTFYRLVFPLLFPSVANAMGKGPERLSV